ncbi:MAG: 4-hydroxy-tetrahydrodipicolinate reductase [Chitinophagaceae bacterium]
MSKIGLLGYGKMGKIIEKISLERNHEIIFRVDTEKRISFTEKNLQEADVVIEFTNPQSVVQNVAFCLNANVPVVSGTTGWLQQWNFIEELCQQKQGRLIYSSNFSIGINIFFALNTYLAKMMNRRGYQIEMKEIHHTEKKDTPSGTAISLAEQILSQIDLKKSWANHSTNNQEIIPIISERIGGTPGTHSVAYTSSIDDIEIKHTAHNREGFALGAVFAVEFLIAQKPGIYSMMDILKLG